MDLHVRCLYTHDGQDRTVAVNEPDNTSITAARFHLGRTSRGNIWRFHRDVPALLADRIEELCEREPALNDDRERPPLHAADYLELIESNFQVFNVSAGPLYHWAKSPAIFDRNVCRINEKNSGFVKGAFEEMSSEVATWQPFVALLEDERAVSVCRSARITEAAHEAGVETLPEFRGRGYAAKVTDAWARDVLALGGIPLYSTSWENNASQAVARKLNLEFVGSDYEIG